MIYGNRVFETQQNFRRNASAGDFLKVKNLNTKKIDFVDSKSNDILKIEVSGVA